MNSSLVELMKVCMQGVAASVLLVFALSLPAEGRHGSQRLEHAPEIRVQKLEKKFADHGLKPHERSQIGLALARTLYEAGDFEREAEVLEEIIVMGIPQTHVAADAHYYLGRTYQALGENDLAAEEFDILWRNFPNSRFAHHAALQLGDLMAVNGYDDAAVEWYRIVIDGKPDTGVAFLARDKIRNLAAGSNPEDIMDESRRPVHLNRQVERLSQYLYSRMYNEADQLADHLINSRTNDALRAAMHHHMAHQYWMYGHAEGAKRFVPNMLNVGGARRIKAWILAGHINRVMGLDEEALRHYEAAIHASPAKRSVITAYEQSIRLNLRKGDVDAAMSLAERGRRAFRDNEDEAAYLGRISDMLRNRAHPKWREYAERTAEISMGPRGYRALHHLAREARLREDWAQAENYSRHLANRSSWNVQQVVNARMALLQSMMMQGKDDEAGDLEQLWMLEMAASNSAEDQAYGYYRLGRTFHAMGIEDRAEDAWRHAVQQFPLTRSAAKAQVNLARHYEARGDLNAAVKAWERYLEFSETEPHFALRAQGHLLRLYQALDQKDETQELQARVGGMLPQVGDAQTKLNLSQHYLLQGHAELARDLLERGLEEADILLHGMRDDNQRLWWEYLVARRLQDFGEHGRIVARLTAVESELLANPALNDDLRFLCYFSLMRALEFSGQWSEAEAAAVRAIGSMPAGSRRLGDVAYRIYEQARARGDEASVRAWATATFNELPSDHLSQFMYLQLAAEDFNQGRIDEAFEKIVHLEEAIPISQRPGWAEHFKWEHQYLKGRCLREQGQREEGENLMVEALSAKRNLTIPLSLHESDGGREP